MVAQPSPTHRWPPDEPSAEDEQHIELDQPESLTPHIEMPLEADPADVLDQEREVDEPVNDE